MSEGTQASGPGWRILIEPSSADGADAQALGAAHARTVLATQPPIARILLVALVLGWLLNTGIIAWALDPFEGGEVDPVLLVVCVAVFLGLGLGVLVVHRHVAASRRLALTEQGFVLRVAGRRVAAAPWEQVGEASVVTGTTRQAPSRPPLPTATLRIVGSGGERLVDMPYPRHLAEGLGALLERHAGARYAGVQVSEESL